MSDFSGRTPKKIEMLLPQDGFYPDIEVGDFQETMRVPSDWREAAIKMQVVEAIVALNAQISTARNVAVKAGVITLDMPLANLYRLALYHLAKAKLLRLYPEMNRRDRSQQDARDQNGDYESADSHDDAARPLISQLISGLKQLAESQQQIHSLMFERYCQSEESGDSVRVLLV